jgi:tetratricopeptide (TPR) repeat protein
VIRGRLDIGFAFTCAAAGLVLALAAPAPCSAQSLDALFREGNAAYIRGDFAAASRAYDRLIEAGVRDADVYFNAATAHARKGELGHAVLGFERCLWIRASDDGCELGLRAAQAELGKLAAKQSGEATVRARPPLSEALVRPFSANVLAGSLLALDALLFGLLFARSRVQRESVRLGITIAAPLAALLLLLGFAGLAVKAGYFDEGPPAVVLRETPLREGPDPRAVVRGQASPGLRGTLGARQGGYAEARLAGGLHGWVKASDLGLIRSD